MTDRANTYQLQAVGTVDPRARTVTALFTNTRVRDKRVIKPIDPSSGIVVTI